MLCTIGLTTGLISGAFGIGGGILIIPALVYILGYSLPLATGTSLAVLLPPIGLAAAFEYYRHGNVDIRAAAIIAVCLFAAAWVGAFAANRVNPAVLKVAFGVFVTIVGISMTVGAVLKLRG
jgi:hypothetical protein